MQIPLLDLTRQYATIKDEIQAEINKVLESAQFIMGTNVKLLEQEIAEYVGAKYAISCANGTDALVIALTALGIGLGDEVITTPYTFFATAEAIARVGATPVFVDVDVNTYNMDVNQIEQKITNKTKAILPVHIFGQSAEMDSIMDIAKKYKIYVVEDACQAIGASYGSAKCGSIGDLACFSFFPTKNLGCYGDGGMITTNDERLYKIIKSLRVHGGGQAGKEAYNIVNSIEEDNGIKEVKVDETLYNPAKYYNYMVGFNSRLDEIQAAILRVKLKRLDHWNNKRQELSLRYNELLKETDLITPFVSEKSNSVYHMYILQVEDRQGLTKYLADNGIATGVYYPVPLHLQKAFENLGYAKGDMPVSEYLSLRTFAIPMYPDMTYDEQVYVVDTIKNYLKEVH